MSNEEHIVGYLRYAQYITHGLMFVYMYMVLFVSVYLGIIYILDKGSMRSPHQLSPCPGPSLSVPQTQ